MIKKSEHITAVQIERLAEKLPIRSKIRLAHKLAQQTSAAEMDSAVRSMQRSIQKASITAREIDQICKDVKREREEMSHENQY